MQDTYTVVKMRVSVLKLFSKVRTQVPLLCKVVVTAWSLMQIHFRLLMQMRRKRAPDEEAGQ